MANFQKDLLYISNLQEAELSQQNPTLKERDTVCTRTPSALQI